MSTDKCSSCGVSFKPSGWSQGSFAGRISATEIKGQLYCPECTSKYVQTAISSVRITTTPSLDGFRVKAYLGIESVEVVLGTGSFSEFDADVADFFGTRATEFEKKLQIAKRTALDKLRLIASENGANAVIGIDLDYTEFSGNRIGVVVSGTLVEVVPQ